MATLTSFQERSGFQQHKYIILHFWKSEVQTQSHWAKDKVHDICLVQKCFIHENKQ